MRIPSISQTVRTPRALRVIAFALILLSATLGAVAGPTPAARAQDGPARAGASDPHWLAQYYNNTALAGTPILTRTETELDHDWGTGSPDAAISGDNFSARWTRYLWFDAGVYRFTARMDDGMRVFIDDQMVLEQWRTGAVRTFVVDRTLTTGHHLVRVEYFEGTGNAVASLTWGRASEPPPPAPSVGGWWGEYFNNRNLEGTPVLVRDDGNTVDFAWGEGSPAPGIIDNDNFSVRWTRGINFAPGTWRFTVTVDDGARLWVNNALVIDQWQVQSERTFTADVYLAGGAIPLRLDFFEGTGNARIRLQWWRLDGSGGGSGGGGSGGGGSGGDDGGDDDHDDWYAQYYNNIYFDGPVILERREDEIDYDWGYGGPGHGVNNDFFSARWTRESHYGGGRYRFTVTVDDGVRVWVDGRLRLDKWFAQNATKYTFDVSLDRGEHKVVVEYMERTMLAEMRLRIARLDEARRTIGNIVTCVPPQPANYAWIKLYRLDGNNKWYSIARGIGTINATGFLKIDGLPVDVGRFGDGGEPYKVEQWIDGRVAQSTGDFQRGEPEFRVRVSEDNYTPWGCPR